MLNITEKEVLSGKAAAVKLNGTLNSESDSKLTDILFDIIDRGIVNIIVDAEELLYLSSAGIGALLSAVKKVKAHGGIFTIFGLNKELRSLFRILGLDESVTVAAGFVDALGITERFIETEFKPEKFTAEVYAEALIVECGRCGGLMRIKGPGSYTCPDCSAPVYATNNMTVLFE